MVTRKLRWRPLAESHNFHGSLSSEPDEIILPGWLNAARGTRSYDRLVRILDLIRANNESVRNILAKSAHIHTERGGWPREHKRLWRIDSDLSSQLSSVLKRYTFRLRLIQILFGQSWLLALCCNPRKDEFAWEAPYAYKARPGETILTVPTFSVAEGDAVLAVARLAERGLLSRVRLCAMCSDRWFFAKHSNYRFCGATCRENHYTSTEEYRQKKAQQMRASRNKQKLREEAESAIFLQTKRVSSH